MKISILEPLLKVSHLLSKTFSSHLLSKTFNISHLLSKTQRAIRYLLIGDIMSVLKENGLLVLSIPYVLMGFTLNAVKHPGVLVLNGEKGCLVKQLFLSCWGW